MMPVATPLYSFYWVTAHFRIHLARTFSPEDMDWDATAFGPYEDFKNQLEKLQYSVVKNLESMVTGLKAQMENFKKSGKQQQKQPGNGGNGGKSKQSDKKSTSIKDKILKLSLPGGKKAQAKCMEKDGKGGLLQVQHLWRMPEQELHVLAPLRGDRPCEQVHPGGG
jgi:hypothetical protein